MTDPSVYISKRAEWREWLKKNHAKESVIWLIHYKKHTGKPSLAYNEAVEEALCWGWIDSLIRRLDEDRYMQKYTPRKPKSTWSKHNVRRVKKMIAEGKMKPAGLELYEYAEKNGLLPDIEEDTVQKINVFSEIPDFIIAELNQNPEAERNFNALAPSYKLQYMGWIMSAKKKETQIRRLKEAIGLLKSGKKPGMK
jgi:uncharacterized protein YdeI (YjbR/CyaY-like superfamily)